MPYELRLAIYELVLGQRQIHISFKPWEPSTNTKGRRKLQNKKTTQGTSTQGNEMIKGHFKYAFLPLRQDPWLWDTAADGLQSHDDQRITLLSGVCRQLYHETAVLPHRLNAWSFQSTHLMERFFLKDNVMPLFQRKAIQTLYCKDRLAKEVKAKLRGIKIIVWKDHRGRLRWQDLQVFPETTWKDRKELKRRTQRWETTTAAASPLSNATHRPRKSSIANMQRNGDENDLPARTTGQCLLLLED